MSLDTLPDDTAGQVRELTDYQWRSAEGQQHWQNVLDLLRKEVLDAQFAGMKEALSGHEPGRHGGGPGDDGRPQRAAGQARSR